MALPEKVLTDRLWSIIQPLLPREKPKGSPGRPQVLNRNALLGILYVLLNGCPWNAMPRSYGCSPSTCWRRLREWQRRGIWKRVWRAMLEHARPDLTMALVDSSSVQSFKGVGLQALTLLTELRTALRGMC